MTIDCFAVQRPIGAAPARIRMPWLRRRYGLRGEPVTVFPREQIDME